MTRYKNQFVVKIKRRIIAWQETIYLVQAPTEEKAIEIASKEEVYSTKDHPEGIMESHASMSSKGMRRLTQEESWLVSDIKGPLWEIPDGDPVLKVLFVTERTYQNLSQNLSKINNLDEK